MHQLRPYIVLVTLIATLGGLLFGYDTAVISGAVGSLRAYFIDPRHMTDPTEASLILGFAVSSALLGCVLGGMSGGWISVHLGRKKGLVLAAALFLVSSLGSAAPEVFLAPVGHGGPGYLWMFVFYRVMGGIGVGLASMLSPMYIAEIAPASIRGNLVAWNQMAIVFGMVVVYFVNYAISLQGDGAWLDSIGWRYMFASAAIPSALFLGLLLLVPETPRYLMLKGRPDEARQVLSRLVSPVEVEQEMVEIGKSLAVHHSRSVWSFGTKVIFIGVLLSFFQQFVGINVVLYYAPTIFKGMGLGGNASLIQTIAVGVVNFAFTIVAILTVDGYGRRPLMIIGALAMGGSMIALGAVFAFQITGFSALICMLIYIAAFAMSWGPVTWVLLSEIFPNQIRGTAMAIAVAVQWIANFVVSETFPLMDNNPTLVAQFHHGFAYFGYGVMSLLAALFVWKMVPETKGQTLEGMEALWDKKS